MIIYNFLHSLFLKLLLCDCRASDDRRKKICNAAAAAALCLDDADDGDGDDEEKMKLNFRQANFHKSGVITKVDKLIAPRLIFCWFFTGGL